jgi:hypothetical protein
MWKALQDGRLRTHCELLIGPDGHEYANRNLKPEEWKDCSEFGWQNSSALFKFRNGGRWNRRVIYKADRIEVKVEDIEGAFAEAKRAHGSKDRASPVSRADLRSWFKSLEDRYGKNPPSQHRLWDLAKREFGDRVTRQSMLNARPVAWKDRPAGRPRK